MKNLNYKSQSVKTKIKAYCGSVAFMALMCTSSISQAMNLEADELRDLQARPFRIHNNKTNTNLCPSTINVWDDNGSQTVHSKEDIPTNGNFIIEVNDEGIRIKNVANDKYLLAAGKKIAWGIYDPNLKYIGASNANHAGCYVDIYKYAQGFVIKTKDGYARLTDHKDRQGERYLISDPKRKSESYFTFIH